MLNTNFFQRLFIFTSTAAWSSLYSLGTDPIGNTALALLSGHYQVTPSEQIAGGTKEKLVSILVNI
jgi:hypothetical protein